jgi:HK97 gp10 family phage protein
MSQTKFYGFSEFQYVLQQMNQEFGVQDARKNILIPAAKKAMQIVLQAAKDNLYPDHGLDTGQLKRTLTVSARAVKPRDLRSMYVKQGDVIIATVSAKLDKKILGGINVGDASDARAIAVEFGTKNKNTSIEKPKGMSKKGHLALQREFGTVRMAARPYLRPALENKQAEVVQKLGEEIKIALDKYRSKNMG